jgi:hypothetical protein
MPQPKVIDKKGMDAIFSGVVSQDSGVIKPESELHTKESDVPSKESGVGTNEYGVVITESGVNMAILTQAIKQGIENPRISSWNPLVMAVLRYRNLTTPAYSMSKEISELLESAVRERYPELTEKIEKALSEKS